LKAIGPMNMLTTIDFSPHTRCGTKKKQGINKIKEKETF